MIEYRLTFSGGLNVDTANHLRARIASILERQDFGWLTIQFSSEGGSADQGVALYSFLRTLSVPVHMHAMGHVGSAAVPLFLGGETRTCEPLARFFFHEYDWTFAAAPQTLRRIDEAAQRLKDDIQIARGILNERATIPVNALAALDGAHGPIIMSPDEAKAAGIVSDVLSMPASRADGSPVAVWT